MSNPFLDKQIYDASCDVFIPCVTNFSLDNLYNAVQLVGIRSREPRSIKVLVDLRIHDTLHVRNALDFYPDGKVGFAHYFEILVRHEYDQQDRKSYTLITGPCGKQVCLITREM